MHTVHLPGLHRRPAVLLPDGRLLVRRQDGQPAAVAGQLVERDEEAGGVAQVQRKAAHAQVEAAACAGRERGREGGSCGGGGACKRDGITVCRKLVVFAAQQNDDRCPAQLRVAAVARRQLTRQAAVGNVLE